jgi:DNA-binding transcriptional MerR regulator
LEKSYNKLEDACQLIEKEWFDRAFFGYFLKEGIAYTSIVRRKKFKLTGENVSSRVLNHWVNKGIFHDDRKDKKGWKVFSMTDTMLLTIIKRLRHFGLDLDKIKKVTDYLYSYNYLDLEANCLLLDFYISYGLMDPEPINLIVNGDADAAIVRQSTLQELLQMGILSDYLVIDLKALLAKGSKNEFPNVSQYPTLKVELMRTHLEEELDSALEKDGIQNINIRIKENDYTVTNKMLMGDKESAEALINLCAVAKLEEAKDLSNKRYYTVSEIKKVNKNG